MTLLISGSYNLFSSGWDSCGIYLASGIVSDNSYERPIYIGSAMNMKKRIFDSHLPALSSNTHYNEPMQTYANEHGLENLVWFALETHEKGTITPKEILNREQIFFDEIAPFARLGKGFNLAEIAGSPAGVIRNEETRAKMSAALKGNKRWLGRKHSQESKEKISQAAKGKPKSLEARAKMSKAKQNISEETRAKISAASLGNKNCVGRKHSAETKAKMSKANLGRAVSAETKEKMSLSRKTYLSKNRTNITDTK